MSQKRGPPAPGASRPLTRGEADALGCAVTWHIVAGPDGVWLMKPWRRSEWVGPGPRLSVVRMTPTVLARVRARLRRFWDGRRVTLSPDHAERMLRACQNALCGHMVKKEMEWAVAVLGG